MDIKEIIEKALQGREVVLRNGRKGYVRHVEGMIETKCPVIGFAEMPDGSLGAIGWTLNGRSLANSGKCGFDIVDLSPLEFDHWSLLDERVAAIAKNSDGKWWAHEGIPEYVLDGWLSGGFVCSLEFFRVDFPPCGCQDSLIVRPVNGDSE